MAGSARNASQLASSLKQTSNTTPLACSVHAHSTAPLVIADSISAAL